MITHESCGRQTVLATSAWRQGRSVVSVHNTIPSRIAMRRSQSLTLLVLLTGFFATASLSAEEHVKLVIDYGDGVEKHFTQLSHKEGLTVLGATQLAGKHTRGVQAKVRGSGSIAFLTQIDDVSNEGGGGRNWVFRVNGKLGDRSCGIYELKPGDTVLWRFQKYE